jgi:hypothetical protein
MQLKSVTHFVSAEQVFQALHEVLSFDAHVTHAATSGGAVAAGIEQVPPSEPPLLPPELPPLLPPELPPLLPPLLPPEPPPLSTLAPPELPPLLPPELPPLPLPVPVLSVLDEHATKAPTPSIPTNKIAKDRICIPPMGASCNSRTRLDRTGMHQWSM